MARRIIARAALLSIGFLAPVVAGAQQLNEHCVVSILNRNAQVRPDGSWQLPNVPAGFGPVRARATCVEDGVTRSGQSDLFVITPGRMSAIPPIILGPTTPIPTALAVTAGTTTLSEAGATTQLTVMASYSTGSPANVTAAGSGTTYNVSNSGIATVSVDGLVTAVRSGTVLIRAANEGTAGLISIQVVLGGDADGDGITDDVELAEGLNPNDPSDALEDADRDGLSNRDEVLRGTQLRNPDTDGDTIRDGEEVVAGADGFVTNPLLADTDGDGVRDALEIATATDPTSAASVNLGAALNAITVAPTAFVLTVNTIVGEASVQLTVTGQLRDGTTIDLTSTLRGTNYTSSNLAVCNFGSPDGRVFASSDGTCTITVTNSGFSAEASGSVTSFTPVPLSFVAIPGFANNVDVSGDFAYVAAGSTGLQVVSVSNRNSPVVVAARDTAGNANDVVVVGNLAYVADGGSGLQIIDVSNPLTPTTIGSLNTPGDAWDVVVRGNRAYIADGASGLRIVDVSAPATPQLLGSIDPPGTQKGVAVDPIRQIAVLASGSSGVHVVDISNPAAPALVGSVSTAGDARDVVLKESFAFVADFSRSFTSVDITDPTNPIVRGSTPSSTGGLLQDATVVGNFGFGADVFFVNGVPIIDVSDPATPLPRAILNFGSFRDDNGTGIAADSSFLYLTAERGITENGTSGDTRLYIGQYLAREDRAGVPPTVEIAAPASGSTFVQGSSIPVQVNATDDVAVVAVTFLANGSPVFTDTTFPYEFNVPAPSTGTTFTLGARAVDLAGNTGTAEPVTVNLIPDPLTTVIGRVVERGGAIVAGATVTTVGGATSTTGVDGTFTIVGVPTVSGRISVTATATIGGRVVSGTSRSETPVPAGTTNVGDIVLGGNLMVVANSGANTASVIDISVQPPTVVATLPTGSFPLGVSVTPGGAQALVSNFSSGTVTFLDLTTSPPTVAGTSPPVGGAVESTAITSDGRFAVTADGGGFTMVTSIDIASRSIINGISMLATGVVIAHDNRTVITANFGSNVFNVLALSPSGTLTNTGTVLTNPGSGPVSLTMAPNGTLALAPNYNSSDVTVIRIDPAGAVSVNPVRIPFCCNPSGVAISPDGANAYVASSSMIGVFNIDAAGNVTDSGIRFPLGGGPNSFFGVPGIAASPDGTRVFISNYFNSTVSIFDRTTNNVVATITVGAQPAGIGVPR